MRRLWMTFAMAASVAGCAAGSGIVPVGPGVYALAELRAPVLGGGGAAERAVLAEASAFCQQQNLVFLPLTLRPDGDPFTPYYPTAFDATFRCVSQSDPALHLAPGAPAPPEAAAGQATSAFTRNGRLSSIR